MNFIKDLHKKMLKSELSKERAAKLIGSCEQHYCTIKNQNQEKEKQESCGYLKKRQSKGHNRII